MALVENVPRAGRLQPRGALGNRATEVFLIFWRRRESRTMAPPGRSFRHWEGRLAVHSFILTRAQTNGPRSWGRAVWNSSKRLNLW